MVSPYALALLLSCATGPSESPLVINEFHFNPAGADDLEFIELYNRSNVAVDLTDFAFSDASSGPVHIASQGAILESGAYWTIVRDSIAFASQFPGVSIFQPNSWPTLNNSGDTIRLFAAAQAIDQVEYGSDWSQDGQSVERIDPCVPAFLRANWSGSTAPAGATPGIQNSIFNPDKSPPVVDSVLEVPDNVVSIHLSEPVDTTQLSPSHFELNNTNPTGITFDKSLKIIDLTFPSLPRGLDMLYISDIRDWAGNVVGQGSFPLARIPDNGDLIFNEIMYDPFTDPFDGMADQVEYLEIFNRSDRLLNVAGLAVSKPTDENGNADTLTTTPQRPTLFSQNFAILLGSSSSRFATDSLDLVRAFADLTVSETFPTLIHLSPKGLALRNSGDRVILSNQRGEFLDELEYSDQMHHTGLVSTRGISLERLHTNAGAFDAADWTSAVDVSGGTPGRPNSVEIRNQDSPTSARSWLSVYPSPFSPDGDGIDDALLITVRPPETVTIRVRVFDRIGREVKRLTESRLITGESTLVWNGRTHSDEQLETGLYIIVVESNTAGGRQVSVQKTLAVLARNMKP